MNVLLLISVILAISLSYCSYYKNKMTEFRIQNDQAVLQNKKAEYKQFKAACQFPDGYESNDGVYHIAVVPDIPVNGIERNKLILAKKDDPKNAITILNWEDGDLGITLGLTNPVPPVPALNRIGTRNDDPLITGTGYLWGGMGNDVIEAGDDPLYNNEIYGGPGSDTISSGSGDDIIYVDNNDGYAGEGRGFSLGSGNGLPPMGTAAQFVSHPEWTNYVDADAGNDYVIANS